MGLIIFIGLSVVVIIHEVGHFLMSKAFGVYVEEFGLGFPPKIWAKKIGETIYSINWVLWGGFLKINGLRPEIERPDLPASRSFFRQDLYKKALIISGGVLANFFLGWFLISLVMMIGIPQAIFVADIKPGSAAYSADLQKGDLILDFKTAQDFNDYIDQNKGKEVSFKIKRDGAEKEIKVLLPAERSQSGELLGIYYNETGVAKTGIFQGFVQGLTTTLKLLVEYFKGYIALFSRIFVDSSVFQSMVSPIGLFAMASLISKAGLIYLVQLLAILSINLIVFNFLPFPMLDGGWFLLAIIERIKGSPVKPKTEAIVNGLGFVILFSLFLAVTIKDVINLF